MTKKMPRPMPESNWRERIRRVILDAHRDGAFCLPDRPAARFVASVEDELFAKALCETDATIAETVTTDPPIAPGQEAWEHWFAGEIGLAEDCPQQMRLHILRAALHAEVWYNKWNRATSKIGAAVAYRNHEAWRRRAEELRR